MSVGITDNLITKTCTCCGKVRAIADYHRKTPDRYDSRCKPCVSQVKKNQYKIKAKKAKIVSNFEITFLNGPNAIVFARAVEPLVVNYDNDDNTAKN